MELVVFADDWGRHPSSCQHLVGQLLARYRTLWINTIGTRSPRLSFEDVGKAAVKLRQWLGRRSDDQALPTNLRAVSPLMYPGFRRAWQRRINARLIARSVGKALGKRSGCKRVAVATVPIVADLIGKLDVDRWVYYCVDDFSSWPGLDGPVMAELERQVVLGVDVIVCVSRTLQQRAAALGRSSELLTHGIDLSHWQAAGGCLPDWWSKLTRPIALFWGLVDKRLDFDCCRKLASRCGCLVLAGPQQSPDRRLSSLSGVVMPGAIAYEELPVLAAGADVLVMPYADLPVTRAMQPLKFKEYLATGKPVVVRQLPATVQWSDAADIAANADQFVEMVVLRIDQGLSQAQQTARQRLAEETWSDKARQFQRILLAKLGGD